MRSTLLVVILTCLLSADLPADGLPLDRPGRLHRAWYTPHQLLPLLAERDGLRWAMPETLAGLALVGGEGVSAKAALDEACKGWGLSWEVVNNILVIHTPDDAKLKQWSAALDGGGPTAVDPAWELGWQADARALPALSKALASKDPAVALAAAQAISVLDRCIPLGRTHRVDPPLAGRVPLSSAYPPPANTADLLDSPYPPIRAAALRLLLGQADTVRQSAIKKTAADRSELVRQVRQQTLFELPDGKRPATGEKLPAPPESPEDIEAECRKMLDEIPPLARQSEWEQMRYRVRVLADLSRRGHAAATKALLELSDTEIQTGWFPDYAQMFLSATGGPEPEAKLRAIFAKRNRDTIVRGLEQRLCGMGLLSFTRPHLGEQTVCYVTARRAGRAAYDDLLARAAKAEDRNSHLLDAIGAIGGARAVAVLSERLNHEEANSGTLAFRSAKALGQTGSVAALESLLSASQSDDRFRKHAAVLFLGRIGGPTATKRLELVLTEDSDRFIRAAAADALEQIGSASDSVAAFRKADASPPTPKFEPRNKRLGKGFASGQWVDLKIRIRAFANYGEMGWSYDVANRLYFRYGGCSGYTNELTIFDLGTEKFVQRRPNEEMAGWDDRRPPRGCSAGRTWDPYLKTAWIGPAIGGSAADLAIEEYYNKDGGHSLATYDLATDRFEHAERPVNCGRYVYDWANGLMIPVTFTHRNHITKDWRVLNTRAADPRSADAWLNKTNPDGEYPFIASHRYTTAEVHQATGTLVLYVPQYTDQYAKKQVGPETWTWDPKTNTWKNMQPKVQPSAGVWGSGFVYDPFTQKLILHAGRKTSQYGGEDDAMTWTYDIKTNTWTDLGPGGPGNPWVGAMAFDPEHNVVVVFQFRGGSVWAYRHKEVQ